MPTKRLLILASLCLLLAGGLSACREEEQVRQLIIEKGVYEGPVDESLSEEQRRALEQRGRLQRY